MFHSFDAVTGEFLGSREPPVDPLETQRAGTVVRVRPGQFDTETPPPVIGANQVACWDGTEWQIKPDFRGETWFQPNRMPVVIDFIGDPTQVGLLATAPPPTLEEVRAECAESLRSLVQSREAEFEAASFGGVAKNPGLAKAADRSLEDPAGVSESDAALINAARAYMAELAADYGRADGEAMARDLLAANDLFTIRKGRLAAKLSVGLQSVSTAADGNALATAFQAAHDAIKAVQ